MINKIVMLMANRYGRMVVSLELMVRSHNLRIIGCFYEIFTNWDGEKTKDADAVKDKGWGACGMNAEHI